MNEQLLVLISELGEDKAIKVLTREINTIKRIENQKKKELEESKKIKYIDLEKARIEELNLPGATYIGLYNSKIFEIKDLIKYSRKELLEIKRLTEKRIDKIEDELSKYGLRLKEEL